MGKNFKILIMNGMSLKKQTRTGAYCWSVIAVRHMELLQTQLKKEWIEADNSSLNPYLWKHNSRVIRWPPLIIKILKQAEAV